MGCLQIGTPRPAEEDHPVHLDETGGRQRPGQSQHGRGHRNHGPEDAAPQNRALECRLKGQPFRDEAVKRRESRNGDAADQKADRGDGHPADKSAHFFHVVLPALLQDGAGAKEQETLEQGVVETMVQGGDQGQGGDFHMVLGIKNHRQAEADIDDADVFHAVIGEQPFEIMLHQGIEYPEKRRSRADQEDQHPPLPGDVPEQVVGKTNETVDRHLEHDPGHERRDMGRGHRMGLGQPDMERDNAGLQAESDQGEEEGDGRPGRAQPGGLHDGETEAAGETGQHAVGKK
ncbi:MAG: hypothetical protein ACD_75C01172G0003 [uncultured bacterium]|nr:MAG: hypothetical protein ACD_75C01172G0003 [uncultured bacterium]